MMTIRLKPLVSQEVERIDTELTLLNDQERSYKEGILAETNERNKFRLRLKLEALSHAQAGMMSAKASLLSFSAPVNTLPDAFLAHIFIIAATPPDWILRLSTGRQFPLIISQVCKRWQRIALATPLLWCCLTFRNNRDLDFHTERLALKRSGPCFLYVEIFWHCLTDHKKAIAVVLDLLQPHIHRIRSFDATVIYSATMQLILKRFSNFSPVLERLVLHHNGIYPNDGRLPPGPMPLLTASTPQLMQATFDGVNVPWDDFPFTNLEDLHLIRHPNNMRPSWIQFVEILSKLPRLRALNISNSGPSFDPACPPSTWPIEPITLPVVRFALSAIQQDVAIEMLRRFILPNVQDVRLDIEADSMTLDMLCMKQTFATTQKLTTVDNLFGTISVTDSNIRDSFGFPNITYLTFRLNPTLIDALSNPDIPCFPKLDTLVTSHVAGGPVRSLVQRRMEFHGFPPLKYVEMVHARETAQEDLDWLNEHVESLIFRPSLRIDPEMVWSEDSSDGGMDEDEDEDEDGDGDMDMDENGDIDGAGDIDGDIGGDIGEDIGEEADS